MEPIFSIINFIKCQSIEFCIALFFVCGFVLLMGHEKIVPISSSIQGFLSFFSILALVPIFAKIYKTTGLYIKKKLSQRENRNEILCKLKSLPEIERLFFAWHIIQFGWHEYGHITDEEKKLFQFFPLIKKNLLQFHGHYGFVTNISYYSIDPTAMKIIKNNQYLIPEIK